MTLRAKSRGQQWARWLVAAALAVCAYVVAFRVLYEGALGDVFGAMQLRVLLPVLAAFGVLAYETRWDGVVRNEKEKVGGGGESREEKVERIGQGHREEESLHSTTTTNNYNSSPTPTTNANSPAPGEAEYVQARGIQHQKIPEYGYDDEYLELLEKSAELGYPRALAKLGDYAMRRGWNVEAYYWMWRAKRAGVGNLERTLLLVRSAWARGGYSREQANTSRCFPYEQGTVGYALLCIDARHNADAAKARLAECAPEFLVGG